MFTLEGRPPERSAGNYQWNASYNGDPNNNAVSDNGPRALLVIAAVSVPTITTTPTPTTVTPSDAIPPILLRIRRYLGMEQPTGTITFTLFFNGGTVPVDTETVTVSGNGTYTIANGFDAVCRRRDRERHLPVERQL